MTQQPPYKLSASCLPEELLSRLGVAVCNLYGILDHSTDSSGNPLDMSAINDNLTRLGIKIEPHTPNLVDIIPGGDA